MTIEYTNKINQKRSPFLRTILIVFTFLLLIPTSLIFIGKQAKKDPTGDYLSPLPQGEITQKDTSSNLTIASPEQEEEISISTEGKSNAITITTTLPAGKTELEIINSQITPRSYIYIIPHTKINQTISATSKKEGSFTLTTNEPFDTDISLDYWIINY